MLFAALPAAAATETVVVLAAAEPPGPSAELGAMAQQLRVAYRELTDGVLSTPELQLRFGETQSLPLADLARGYTGAVASFKQGEYDTALLALQTVENELEKVPESGEAYTLWIRVLLRRALYERALGHQGLMQEAMERLLRVVPDYRLNVDEYSNTFRRDFEAVRARVAARPRRRLTVTSLGQAGTVYVNGRPRGSAPVTLTMPAGRYRIGGVVGTVHVPSRQVNLQQKDQSLVLDFPLAEALRPDGGPGLALGDRVRAAGVIRAGIWLGVNKVVAAGTLAVGEKRYLTASLYDVRRSLLVREGRVRLTAGAAPAASLEALAAYLFTGQQSAAVESAPLSNAVVGGVQEALVFKGAGAAVATPAATATATPAATTGSATATAPDVATLSAEPRANLAPTFPSLLIQADPPAGAPKRPRVWTWVALGTAAAVAGVATYYGLSAQSASRQLTSGTVHNQTETQQLYGDLHSRARTANILFAVAGAAGAAGVTLFFVEGTF